jgi:serine/threonine protein kinase
MLSYAREKPHVIQEIRMSSPLYTQSARGVLDRHTNRASVQIQCYQNWMMHYLPTFYYQFEQGSILEKIGLWRKLAALINVKVPIDRENDTDQETLYKEICRTVRPRYLEYLKVGIRRMLGLHGYKQSLHRQQGGTGAWSNIIDINQYKGRPCKLLGKIMATYEDGEPNFSAVCYNEITVSKQVECDRVIDFHDVVVAGCGDPVLAMGTVCMIQKRYNCDLSAALKSGEFQSSPEKLFTAMMHIAEGLANIHNHQFIHMDLKPPNIVVNDDGPVICDFGLSFRCVTQEQMDARKVTSWYRPPELVLACWGYGYHEFVISNYDYSVDLWSLGMVYWDFLVQKPFMSTIKMYADESSAYMDALLEQMILVLGPPNLKDVEDWGCSSVQKDHFRTLLTSKSSRGNRLFEHARGELRPHIRQWPESMIRELFDLIGELLSWRPKARPTASLVWSKMLMIKSRHIIKQTLMQHPYLNLSPLCSISEQEMHWRRNTIQSIELESWWDRSFHTVQWCEKLMREVMPTTPTIATNPETYLDVLALSCELMMRIQYIHADVDFLFSDEKIHSACTSLAIQLTRPWWQIHALYRELKTPTYECQQVEQFIAFSLAYRLYTENIVTQLKRKHPFSRLPYDDTKRAFVVNNSFK